MKKLVINDKEVEKIWDALENISFDEGEHSELLLGQDFYIWQRGTPQIDIWVWMNQHHSLGLDYLMNVRES